MGSPGEKPALVNVLSWGSWIFRVHECAWTLKLQLSTYATIDAEDHRGTITCFREVRYVSGTPA